MTGAPTTVAAVDDDDEEEEEEVEEAAAFAGTAALILISVIIVLVICLTIMCVSRNTAGSCESKHQRDSDHSRVKPDDDRLTHEEIAALRKQLADTHERLANTERENRRLSTCGPSMERHDTMRIVDAKDETQVREDNFRSKIIKKQRSKQQVSARRSRARMKRENTKARRAKRAEKLEKLYAMLDTDGSGEVDFKELCAVCNAHTAEEEASVRALFDMLDLDQSGAVNCEELEKALKEDAEARELADQFDALHDFVLMFKVKKKKRKPVEIPRNTVCTH